MERINFLHTLKRLPIVLVVAISPIISSCVERQSMCLEDYPVEQFNSNLSSSINSFNYSPASLIDAQWGTPYWGRGHAAYQAARYPNGHNARQYLNNVRLPIKNLPEIPVRLDKVYESIPDELEIKQVDGKNVDYVTFTPQVKEIIALANDSSNYLHLCLTPITQ